MFVYLSKKVLFRESFVKFLQICIPVLLCSITDCDTEQRSAELFVLESPARLHCDRLR